jgi:CheY-like chemotaxis protein
MMILARMLAANEDKTLPPRQVEWATTIHSAGCDLLALINQILDLSKVEAGRIETRVNDYRLDDVRDFAERTFRPVAVQQELEFSVELGDGLPDSVATDRQLLEQILKNLLANAFKFTQRGRVGMRIDRAPAGIRYRSESLRRAPAVLSFSVSDTGIGIPPEQQEKVFEAFQQADSSITRKYGGTGLGLTISREYAQLLGGEIAVESVPGEGSTFTLYLPFGLPGPKRSALLPMVPSEPMPQPEKAEAGGQPIAPASPEEAARLAGRKVLIVEDDARNLYAVTTLLEDHQMTVIPASSAHEAYARLREHPDIDVVLMDIMMPEVDGLQATREIRNMTEFARLPIIALTAKATQSGLAQATAAGCTGYLVKPAEPGQVLTVIAQSLPPLRSAP